MGDGGLKDDIFVQVLYRWPLNDVDLALSQSETWLIQLGFPG